MKQHGALLAIVSEQLTCVSYYANNFVAPVLGSVSSSRMPSPPLSPYGLLPEPLVSSYWQMPLHYDGQMSPPPSPVPSPSSSPSISFVLPPPSPLSHIPTPSSPSRVLRSLPSAFVPSEILAKSSPPTLSMERSPTPPTPTRLQTAAQQTVGSRPLTPVPYFDEDFVPTLLTRPPPICSSRTSSDIPRTAPRGPRRSRPAAVYLAKDLSPAPEIIDVLTDDDSQPPPSPSSTRSRGPRTPRKLPSVTRMRCESASGATSPNKAPLGARKIRDSDLSRPLRAVVREKSRDRSRKLDKVSHTMGIMVSY